MGPESSFAQELAIGSYLYLLQKHNYIKTTVKRIANIICRYSFRAMRYFLIQNKQFVHIKYIHNNITFSPTLQLNNIFRE